MPSYSVDRKKPKLFSTFTETIQKFNFNQRISKKIIEKGRMETTVEIVKNTGVKLSETYIYSIYASKQVLQEQVRALPMFTFPRVSFNEGLLADTPNSFEFRVMHNLSEVQVHFPVNLRSSTFGVYVSDMRTLFLTEQKRHIQGDTAGGRIKFTPQLVERYSSKMEYVQSPWTTVIDCDDWEMPDKPAHDHYRLKGLTIAQWPSDVDALKVHITVAKLTRAEFNGSQNDLSVIPSIPVSDLKCKTAIIGLSQYFLSSKLSDVSIRCALETFPAHIFVIAHYSEVFEKMFEVDMKEAHERTVEIKDADSDAVREMLRYFYTQKVEHLEINGTKLYELADGYLVEDLKVLCSNFLAKYVNVENGLEMWYFGRKHDIEVLTDKAKYVLIQNRKNFVKHYSDFQTLLANTPARLVDDLFQILMG